MKLSCCIVDDEYHAIEILQAYIRKTPWLELKGSFTEPLDALQQVASADPPMITFLDVDMPELSGMEFAGMVSVYTRVIFTTSFPEYAIEAFEKEAADYLLKPISYERFLKAVNKIKKTVIQHENIRPPAPGYFYVKSDLKGKFVKIKIADIIYVEACENYIRFHCGSGKYLAYLTMEEIMDQLPSALFMRIHRSFIINLDRIKSLEHGQVNLDNSSTLPLGPAYKGELLESLKQLLLQSKRNYPG